MKPKIRIGVVCLARKTFDYPAAEQLYRSLIADLSKEPDCHFECIPQLLFEVEEARAAAEQLRAATIDGLVCISGTFHLGHLVLELHSLLQKPLLLWGLPELPYDGGKIRLNSVCGVNLNASNLYKSGMRHYQVTIGAHIDRPWLDAIRINVALEKARLGIVGYHAHGFFNLGVDELAAYRQMGCLIDHYELEHIFAHPVTAEAIAAEHDKLLRKFAVDDISPEQVTKVSTLAAKLRAFYDEHQLSAIALRCWPEFAASYGISPCASMSLLQSEDYILACEGDLDGALSMIAHRAAGGQTPFLADFSQVDLEQDHALLWHCGVAPCNLHDGRSPCSLDSYFAGGKGVTADFVLKEGEVSLLRLDSLGPRYRIFLQKGRGLPMEKQLKGTYLKVSFDQPVRKVLGRIVDHGIAHHLSLAYGDVQPALEILAKLKGWDLI